MVVVYVFPLLLMDYTYVYSCETTNTDMLDLRVLHVACAVYKYRIFYCTRIFSVQAAKNRLQLSAVNLHFHPHNAIILSFQFLLCCSIQRSHVSLQRFILLFQAFHFFLEAINLLPLLLNIDLTNLAFGRGTGYRRGLYLAGSFVWMNIIVQVSVEIITVVVLG